MFKERIKTHHSAMADGKKYLRGVRNIVSILDSEVLDERSTGLASNKHTIYIHVPFCTKICTFCNMQRSLQAPIPNYGELVIQEILQYAKLSKIQNMTFDAVYFGGGTPTTLPTESLRNIIIALKENLNFTNDAEFTIETTVTQLTDEKLKMFQEVGVNRFSVGVQTFSDEGRKIMGRIGSGQKAYDKLKQIKDMGFAIVSMDLIYNYPGQTLDDLKEDLDKIIELNLDGFSMYSLIDMKETRIDKAQGMDNDTVMFEFIAEYMEKAGFHFLELTKMVKTDGYRYVMNRHQGADTLPLGAGAGGGVCGLAMMNPIQLDQYAQSIEKFNERQGMYFDPSYKEIVKFKGDVQSTYLPRNKQLYDNIETYEQFEKDLLANGYIYKASPEEEYKLTTKGIFWGNTISRELSKLLAL